MAELQLQNVSKTYGTFEAVKDVSLAIEDGEFAVFVGPSGCGKSTLLRLIAGLDPVSAGTVAIGDKDMTARQAGERGVAMVFQSYALYPHMSVFENIAFPLRVERLGEDEVRRRVGEAARILQLESRLEHKPGMLSGGQRQRVAIGRAIVREPRIFLFDEPLSNLDAALRSDMRVELTRLHKRLGATMIYVTHDQVEALTMADKIVVLNGGRIEQVGTPLDLYHRPQNRFVAGFIGNPKMNFLEGRCTASGGSGVTVDLGPLGTIALPRPGGAGLVGETLSVGIRPEHVRLDAEGGFRLALKPGIIERLGIHTVAYSPLPSGDTFVALFEGDPPVKDDEEITVSVDPAACHLFDASGAAIGVPA
mgnify:CR=1 FL=1